MLASLTSARSDETLYSVLARHARYLQASDAGPFMQAVFGRRSIVAGSDLPGHLSYLTYPTREGWDTVETIANCLTAFRFHTAFVSPAVRESVREAMADDVTGIYTRLGLSCFTIRPSKYLQFCPECLNEMEDEYGELWWKRSHQLPGIMVCGEHGTSLRSSTVEIGDRNRHSFVAATRKTCPLDGAVTTPGPPGSIRSRLQELSRSASVLLASDTPSLSYSRRSYDYRIRLGQVGLMRSAKHVDHARMAEAFRAKWSDTCNHVEGLRLHDEIDRSWLAALTRERRNAHHPLKHLMLIGMLDDLDTVAPDGPFGTGPWPCRNPVAPHYGKPAIDTVTVRRSREMVYGDFECSCGYMYTRSANAAGVVGPPKFRTFGPTFAPALRKRLDSGEGLRETAKQFGLDPKSLIRQANMAGMKVPWSTSASGRIPEPTVSRETEVTRPAAVDAALKPARRSSRRNWFALDDAMKRKVDIACIRIISVRPPVRISFAAIERELNGKGWVEKRRGKLPRTIEAIELAVEDTETFRWRRLHFHIELAMSGVHTLPSDILRAAGLPSSWMPHVQAAFAEAAHDRTRRA